MTAPDQLFVPEVLLDELVAHARAEAPLECCGLLIGTGDRLARIARAKNLRASTTRYLVDPADHFAAFRSARADGLTIVGAYHSHPHSPPRPSPTDLAEANDSSLLYVIVSLEPTPDARAYRLMSEGFEPVQLIRVR